jgi:hypothetical protein
MVLSTVFPCEQQPWIEGYMATCRNIGDSIGRGAAENGTVRDRRTVPAILPSAVEIESRFGRAFLPESFVEAQLSGG